MKLPLLSLLLLGTFMQAQTTTYQLGGELCSAASRYPISAARQFDCNGIPVVGGGSVQLVNSAYWIQVHVAGVAEPQQYLASKLSSTAFSMPTATSPGGVVYNYQITDANGTVFHGTLNLPWKDVTSWRGWHSPQIVTTPVNGTLTITPGPLQ